MKKIIIFLGPPGSGKGTQAKKIAERFNYGHISTGDLLRALENKNNLIPEEAAALAEMRRGKLVADGTIYSLVFREIDRCLGDGRGVVLDGAVRTVAQAEKYAEYFSQKNLTGEVIVIEVALPDEESYRRLSNRRVCEKCGEIVPVTSETICPKCSGRLTVRDDDAPAVVRKRLAEQGNAALKPLKEFYEHQGILKIIDGRQTIPEVTAAIEKLLAG